MDDSLENDLHLLLEAVRKTEPETPERKRALGKLIARFWPIAEGMLIKHRRKRGLLNSQHNFEMEEIFDKSMIAFTERIVNEFTMQRAVHAEGSIKRGLMHWFDEACRLKYEVINYTEKIKHKRSEYNLDEKKGDTVEDRKLDGTPRLAGLEKLIEDEQLQSDRTIAKIIEKILVEDPHTCFKIPGPGAQRPCPKTSLSACFPGEHSHGSCLVVFRLQKEQKHFTEISRLLKINHQTLNQCYRRHCLPHIRELVVNYLGYDPKESHH